MEQSRFFHVCTDGTSNGIIFTCDADYQTAIKISAILAYKMGIRIICYCYMTNHSHFVVSCQSEASAKNFIDSFKREYAKYARRIRGVSQIYNEVRSSITEIKGRLYLRNCVSYVLLNPVAAKICDVPEAYRYSSFKAYFLQDHVIGRNVCDIGIRKQRILFGSKANLSDSGFIVDEDNHLVIRSFVDYKFVENLFGSQTWFYKSLALTNSVDEEQKYTSHICRYNDMELYAEISGMAVKRYGKENFLLLTKSEKLSLIPAIERKTHATVKRLARMLRLTPQEIGALLGTMDKG